MCYPEVKNLQKQRSGQNADTKSIHVTYLGTIAERDPTHMVEGDTFAVVVVQSYAVYVHIYIYDKTVRMFQTLQDLKIFTMNSTKRKETHSQVVSKFVFLNKLS